MPADLVHVQDGQAVAACRVTKNLVALFAFADVAGAGVDANHQVRGCVAHALERVGGVVGAVVVPAVFADQQAHLCVADAQHLGHVGAGLKVAALVKDVVRGQQLLGVLQAHGTAVQHQQAVVQLFAWALRRCGGAHHPVQLRQGGRGLLQRGQARVNALQKG